MPALMNARILLFPFSGLFRIAVALRNYLYDRKVLKSTSFDVPVLVVGNLSAGGSGKTPVCEYIIRLYKEEGIQPLVLSRGYGRRTRGFREILQGDTAAVAGDEPLQMKRKFPDVQVFVCENRVKGIRNILEMHRPQKPFCIICDDAFQHRRLRAGFYVLLWTLEQLQHRRILLPAGNWREPDSSRYRSDIQLITKIPPHTPFSILNDHAGELEFDETPVFFSGIRYGQFLNSAGVPADPGNDRLLLVTGIAQPEPLKRYLKERRISFVHMQYPDHHQFSEADIRKIEARFKAEKCSCVLFTEKDFVRLEPHRWPGYIPTLYLPVEAEILKDQRGFDLRMLSFVQRYFPA